MLYKLRINDILLANILMKQVTKRQRNHAKDFKPFVYDCLQIKNQLIFKGN